MPLLKNALALKIMASEEIIAEDNILELLRKHDEQGMRLLYDQYSKALFGVIYRIIQEQETAEEILQETFVKVWHNFDAYNPAKGRLFTWMLSLARNLAIDKTRSAAWKQQNQTTTIENSVYTYKLEATEQPLPEHIGIKDIVERLRPELKDLIDLVYFKGYTQAEAAEKLKIPLGTVKTRVRNAMVELRKIFRILI